VGFYAISTVPLIKQLHKKEIGNENEENIWQAWFADDSSAAGNLEGIKKWWTKLLKFGPKYGYYSNPIKCVLIVKDVNKLQRAKTILDEYEIEITTKVRCYLGVVIGNEEFKNVYIEEKIKEWIEDLKMLTSIAKSELQTAYLAMTFAFQHQWKFVQRTVPSIFENLRKIEHEIHQTLLPVEIDISTEERDILALPVRFRGFGNSQTK